MELKYADLIYTKLYPNFLQYEVSMLMSQNQSAGAKLAVFMAIYFE